MKTLLLLRHAKSAWDDPGLADMERPLTPRGQAAAARMGRHLRDTGLVPERVLCSPARRAAETLALVLAGPTHTPVVDQRPELYLRGWSALLAAVQGLPGAVDRAMLVSHNPDIHELAVALAGSGAPAALAAKYPTGALAVLRFAVQDWRAVAPGTGTLQEFVSPRHLS